jgi:signal transduction histidine kinase
MRRRAASAIIARMPESREELIRSRARVVAAADDTRRRIQRDLHDGAQQRIVQTIIMLKLAKADPSPELIDEALVQAERAMAELRELVQGLMPAALARGGLRSAVEALAERVSVPVQADVEPGRLPAQVETAAYFVIAEALRHAGETGAHVRAVRRGRELLVEVRGAGLERAGDLLDLTDRVAACDGTFTRSGPTLTAALPL